MQQATSNKQQATSNKRVSTLIGNKMSLLFAWVFSMISLFSIQDMVAQTVITVPPIDIPTPADPEKSDSYEFVDGKCCTTIIVPYEYAPGQFVKLEITYCLSLNGGLHEMSIPNVKVLDGDGSFDPSNINMADAILAASNACGKDMSDKLSEAFYNDNPDKCLQDIGFLQGLIDESGEPIIQPCPSQTCIFRIVGASCWGEWVKVSNENGVITWENSPCESLSGECIEVMLICRKKDEVTGEWVVVIEFQPSNYPATCPNNCNAICE